MLCEVQLFLLPPSPYIARLGPASGKTFSPLSMVSFLWGGRAWVRRVAPQVHLISEAEWVAIKASEGVGSQNYG